MFSSTIFFQHIILKGSIYVHVVNFYFSLNSVRCQIINGKNTGLQKQGVFRLLTPFIVVAFLPLLPSRLERVFQHLVGRVHGDHLEALVHQHHGVDPGTQVDTIEAFLSTKPSPRGFKLISSFFLVRQPSKDI